MSKFRRSGSEGSSNSSWGESDAPQEGEISSLALMNELSPEAWLGRFLLVLGVRATSDYPTLAAARRDDTLKAQLAEIWQAAGQQDPLKLLGEGYAEQLKQQDWSAWWRGEEELSRYCYSALALSLLGDQAHVSDLITLYRQSANSRIQKDAHYVLCFLLGKQWPSYSVTDTDLAKLVSG